MADDYEDILDFCNFLQIACENPFDEFFYNYKEQLNMLESYYEEYRQ